MTIKEYLHSPQVHENWELLACMTLTIIGGINIGRAIGRNEK